MIQDTSLEAFRKIRDNGMLSKTKFLVYEAVYNTGNVTSREILTILNLPTNQSGRFTELANLGVIYDASRRKCKITGNQAIAWAVTNGLPIKTPHKNKKEKKKELLNRLGALGIRSTGVLKTELREIYKLANSI